MGATMARRRPESKAAQAKMLASKEVAGQKSVQKAKEEASKKTKKSKG